MSKEEFESIDEILKRLPPNDYEKVKNILYGQGVSNLPLAQEVKKLACDFNFELGSCKFECDKEELRPPRIVRVGLFQNKIPSPTTAPIHQQRQAFHKMAREALQTAAAAGVNIFCFQETWNMPFAFCTKEMLPWVEFAENVEYGPTTHFLSELARCYNMVIVSNVLERDETHNETMWNTVVFIDNHGDYLGKHRKNHVPTMGDELFYYTKGNTGHPVFETEFGRIAANICYGRHHPLNWLMFGLNGAEIVFNPSNTIGILSEQAWGIEARASAVFNNYYTCAVNRVGTEVFPNEFYFGDKKPPRKEMGHFYGSSYVTSPFGARSLGLSRTKTGLLVAELDLNLCRQAKDQWSFGMTQRLEIYAKELNEAMKHNFKPQIIHKK